MTYQVNFNQKVASVTTLILDQKNLNSKEKNAKDKEIIFIMIKGPLTRKIEQFEIYICLDKAKTDRTTRRRGKIYNHFRNN